MRATREHLLAATTAVYVLAHHVGSLPGGLGPAGHGTRVADWIDLLTPFVLLPLVFATLLAAGVSRRVLAVAAVGAGVYLTGHGLHLSANSIGNVAPGETAHFWDEIAGHAIWYSGVAVLAGCLLSTAAGRMRPRGASSTGTHLLALAAGATWASNALGGHFWVGGLLGAAALLAVGFLGWRSRDLRLTALTAGLAAVVVLVAGAVG